MNFVYKRVRTKPRKTKAYVNNRDFYEAIIDYRDKVKAHRDAKAADPSITTREPEIPRYIGECIVLICQKLTNKPNFFGYTQAWKEEMIGDGIEKSIMALKNFDPAKSENPFAYFTQIAYNAFIFRLNKEKDQSIAKIKNFEKLYLMNEMFDEAMPSLQVPTNEYSDEIIRNHEARIERKSKKGMFRKKKKPE